MNKEDVGVKEFEELFTEVVSEALVKHARTDNYEYEKVILEAIKRL